MSGDLKAFLKATEAMPGNVRVIFNAAKEVEDERKARTGTLGLVVANRNDFGSVETREEIGRIIVVLAMPIIIRSVRRKFGKMRV